MYFSEKRVFSHRLHFLVCLVVRVAGQPRSVWRVLLEKPLDAVFPCGHTDHFVLSHFPVYTVLHRLCKGRVRSPPNRKTTIFISSLQYPRDQKLCRIQSDFLLLEFYVGNTIDMSWPRAKSAAFKGMLPTKVSKKKSPDSRVAQFSTFNGV